MAPPLSCLLGSCVLRAALLAISLLSFQGAATLGASDVDDLVQVAFSPQACGHARYPQCLTWWSVDEPWNVGSQDCRGSPLQHWLLPEDGQGVLRPAAYPDLCLEAYRREGRMTHYPAHSNQTVFRTLALRVTQCSGHPSQSFVLSLPGQVGRICLAADHSMCFGENYKCMPDTHLSSEVILAHEEVLRACGLCTTFGTLEVVFPFSMDSPFQSRHLDLAIYNSIIWVLLASHAFYLAGVCLRARHALRQTSLSGVPHAGKLALRLWNRLRSACCSGGTAHDTLKATMDRLRTQRVLAIFNVVVHFLAQLLLLKMIQFYMLQRSGMSVETVNFGAIRDAVSYSELPECLFVFICMLPFWLRPRWVCARTITGFYISVTLFQAFLVVRGVDGHRVSRILLRTVSSLVFAQPLLSTFLNIIVSTFEVFSYSWSEGFIPPAFATCTREFWITSLIVCTAWAQEASMRIQAAALLEAKGANCSRNAVSSLLRGFCDAVVYLDQDIQITDAGKLHGLLLLPSSKSWRNVPFTNLVHSDDVPRVTKHLEMSREALDCTPPPICYPISITLHDMNRVSVRIDLHCTCVQGADDQICYVLGLKEATETVLPHPPESCPVPSALEACDSRPAAGSRSDSMEDNSFESRAADCSSDSDADPGQGDTFRMVAFKPDTFEIVGATTGFEHLAGAAARREYLIDYVDRPGRFLEMMPDLVDGLACGRLTSDQSFRSQRPLVFKFPGRERKVQAMLEISFRSSGSSAAEGDGFDGVAVARLLGVKLQRETRAQDSSLSRSSPRSKRDQQQGQEDLSEEEEEEESSASRRKLESPGARLGDMQMRTRQDGSRTKRRRSSSQHAESHAVGPLLGTGATSESELPSGGPSVLGRRLLL